MMQPHMKVYVQTILEHKEDMIRKLLFTQKGKIYICGSTSMSKEVLSVIQRHVTDQSSKSFSYEDGEKELDRLMKEKQICMEAWN